MPAVLGLRKQRLEDREFKVILGYNREFEANLNDMKSFIKKRKYGLVDWGTWLNGSPACARP